MRHIHNYKSFNEALAISPTDEPSVRKSKEYYNGLELSIKQYNTNKSNLKKFYTSVDKDGNLVTDDNMLNTEVKKLTDKLDTKHDFFIKYLDQLKTERDIIKKQKTQLTEEENLKSLLKTQEDSETNEKDPRIGETEEKMNLNKSDISVLLKKLLKDKEEFKKMFQKAITEVNKSKNIINSPKNNKIQIGNVVSLKK